MSPFSYVSSALETHSKEAYSKMKGAFTLLDEKVRKAQDDLDAQVEQSCVKFCADKNVAPEDCVMLEHTSLTLIEDMGKFHFIAKYKLMTRQEYNELFNTECLP